MAKKVFFLGAGFSKAINSGYPLLSELTKNVDEKLLKASNSQHYGELSDDIKNDVESLLTYLSTDFPWKTDETKYANLSLYHAITKIISDKFKELAKQDQEATYTDIWQKFAEEIVENNDTYDFITLNYDLLLDNLLKSKMQEFYKNKSISYDDFYKYPMTWIGNRNPFNSFGFATYEMFNKPHVPSILKLHGSANWFWAGVNPSDIIYYRNWNQNEDDSFELGLKPYIIPPVMDKNAFYNHIAIRSLWQQAENLLKDADEIYIIGFSFPQTDLSVKYLFQSALRSSNATIYVVNPDTETNLRKNYDKVFMHNSKNVKYLYTGKKEVTKKFIKEKLCSQSIGGLE